MRIDLHVYDQVAREFARQGKNFSSIAATVKVSRATVSRLWSDGLLLSRKSGERRGPIRELFEQPEVEAVAEPTPVSEIDPGTPTDESLIADGRRAASGLIGYANQVIAALQGSSEKLRLGLAAIAAASPERASKIVGTTAAALVSAVDATERLITLERLIAGKPTAVLEQRSFSLTGNIPAAEIKSRVNVVLDAVADRARALGIEASSNA
jgi:hypothetical protein